MKTILVVLPLLLLAPGLAHAQPSAVDEARRHADAGQAALTASDFQRALDEYNEAYRLFPNALLLVNVARAQSGLGHDVDAIETLGRVLADGGVDPARRREVEAEVQRLHGMVVELTLAVTPDGSRVLVNGEEVGVSPLAEPVLVEPGTVEVEATHDGYVTGRWSRPLSAGARTPVPLALERVGSTEEQPDDGAEPHDDIVTPPGPGEPPHRSNTLLWVTGIGGGVLGATSLIMGALQLSAHGDCPKGTDGSDCLRNDSGSLNTINVVADVLGGVALVAGGIFVVLLVTSGGDAEEAAATALAEPGVLHF